LIGTKLLCDGEGKPARSCEYLPCSPAEDFHGVDPFRVRVVVGCSNSAPQKAWSLSQKVADDPPAIQSAAL
jgi:hypothetical protein